MANLTYTIQIQTNHFEGELTHEEYEAIALGLLVKFDEAIEIEGLRPHTTYHASWMKGCVLENIVLTFQNLDSSTQALSAMGTYILLKDYSAISDSVSKLTSHIRTASFFVGDISVRVSRVVVNKAESPPLKHRIEPKIGDLKGISDDQIDDN